MTDTQFLRVLSIALRILRRSQHGTRPRLKRRERLVLGILSHLSLSKCPKDVSGRLRCNFVELVSLSTWEVLRTHEKTLSRFHESLETYIERKQPGEETIRHLIALLSRIRELVLSEGLYFTRF